jgi:hypothetical protein
MPVRCLRGLAGLVFGLVSLVALAQGGPPLLTDDPGTPGNGHSELNIAFLLEKSKGESLYSAPLIDFNYGVGERIQLKAEIPWLIRNETSANSQSGLGNLLLGLKWRFLDENPAGVDLSVYPQFDFNTSAHSRRSGLVPEGMELFLPAEVAKDLGLISVNLELGYLFREEREDEWIWGLALGRKLTDEIEVLGEVHGETARKFNRGELVWNLGARIKLSELNSILVSAGRGIRGESRGEPDFIGYLGLQFNF